MIKFDTSFCLHTPLHSSYIMSIECLKQIYEGGFYEKGTCDENHQAWMALVAMHMREFREVFGDRLNNFTTVIQNSQTRERVILSGPPHQRLLQLAQMCDNLKPAHAVLIGLHRKLEFTRLKKGACSVLLDYTDRIAGSVGFSIEQHACCSKVYVDDDEDYLNKQALYDKYVEFDERNSLAGHERVYFAIRDEIQKPDECAHCQSIVTDSNARQKRRCPRCGSVAYCSRKCQKNHWSQHKKCCIKT